MGHMPAVEDVDVAVVLRVLGDVADTIVVLGLAPRGKRDAWHDVVGNHLVGFNHH